MKRMQRIHGWLGSLGAGSLLFVVACGEPPPSDGESGTETAELEAAMDRKPVAAAWVPKSGTSGYVWLFVRGTNNRLFRRVLAIDGLLWQTGWDELASDIADIPAARRFSDSPVRMVMYARATDGHCGSSIIRTPPVHSTLRRTGGT